MNSSGPAESPTPAAPLPDVGAAPADPSHEPTGRLRRILVYGASRGATEGLLGARGFLLAWLLGPAGYGGWTLFRLVFRYARIATLGVGRGLEFEVGRIDGRADSSAHRDAERYGRTALGFVALSFGVLSVAAGGASLVAPRPDAAMGLRTVAAALVASGVATYALVFLRARGELRRFSTLEVLNAAVHFALAGAGALVRGLGGALAGFAVASFVAATFMLHHVPARPGLDVARLRRLVRIGLPMMSAEFLVTALGTADRLVVAALGGMTLLGHYAFAAGIAGMANAFAWVVRTVVFPDLYGRAEEANAEAAVREHLRELVLPFARLYPPVLGLLALGIGPAVHMLIPDYADAVEPARIFIFTGVAFGFSSLASLSAVTADRQKMLPLFSGSALLLDVGLSALALWSGAGLVGVAAAALFSRTVHGIALLAVSAGDGGLRRPRRYLLRSTLPLVYCVAIVDLLARLFPDPGARSAVLASVAYAVLLLPLAPAMLRGVRTLRTRT